MIVSEETGADQSGGCGNIERNLTVEQLRKRLGELLRRYLPPSTLPTVIHNGIENREDSGPESSRTTMSRAADSRSEADSHE